jgi:DNA-binding transcriptional regulator LsrR (DeoR family)
MKKRGRSPTTGKFQTRKELVNAVCFYYHKTNQHQAQVARTCQVSEGTVARIIATKK